MNVQNMARLQPTLADFRSLDTALHMLIIMQKPENPTLNRRYYTLIILSSVEEWTAHFAVERQETGSNPAWSLDDNHNLTSKNTPTY